MNGIERRLYEVPVPRGDYIELATNGKYVYFISSVFVNGERIDMREVEPRRIERILPPDIEQHGEDRLP